MAPDDAQPDPAALAGPGGANEGSDGNAAEAWVFIRREAIPERWRGRVVDVGLVPLLPAEAEDLLGGRSIIPGASAEDERLLRLLARGSSVARIAEEMNITTRSVERRLASLRRRFGLKRTSELALLAARRGL